MAKFSGSDASTKRTFASAPTKTKSSGLVSPTHEGGVGYEKGDKTALFTLAVTNMVGESSFYESAGDRDNRFRDLVRKVAVKDPQWIANFIPFLRDTANMRSASVVCATEAAVALVEARKAGKDIDVSIRDIVNSACSRADEPAEVLGYWLANYGRRLPMSVKRGIGDAATRLYSEWTALKYDGGSRGVRMGDVLNLVHPTPTSGDQSMLFEHLLDRRHGHVNEIPEALTTIRANEALKSIPEAQRREVLRSRGNEALAEAGMTWEALSGWLPGGMDAEAWESIIPSMGYMALLRNLRNFEEAKVSKSVLKAVRDKLEDPEQVAKSRQFPYRFWSAYKNSGSTFFASTLEIALDLSCQNIPEFPGRTLVAIDTSGSMQAPVSGNSNIKMFEIGALFGAAVAAKSKNCQVILYATNWEPLDTKVSVLRTIEQVQSRIGRVGMGTNTWPSVAGALKQFGEFDRIVTFTDMQDHPPKGTFADSGRSWMDTRQGGNVGIAGKIPADAPVYTWDLGGYAKSNVNTNTPGRYLFGGFSDACFRMIPLLEASRDAAWPWEK